MNLLARRPARAIMGTFALGVTALICRALMGGTSFHSTSPIPFVEGTIAAVRPATTVEVISCSPLPHVSGKSITTAVVTFPPGACSPRHRHPGSVTTYVQEGTKRSQLAGSEPGLFAAGQGWFEPPGAVHLFADNTSDHDTARVLAVFVAEDGCGPLVVPDQPYRQVGMAKLSRDL